jgi:surface antigen
MMKKLITGLMFLVCLSSFNLFASNELFMSNMPIANFTDKDTDMFKSTMDQALDHGRDGKKVAWKNPDSGAHGYFIPSQAKHSKGLLCRQLEIYSEAQTVTGKSSFQFCKMQGKWVITH